jgi:flagellar hook-basal body complex protein FliE
MSGFDIQGLPGPGQGPGPVRLQGERGVRPAEAPGAGGPDFAGALADAIERVDDLQDDVAGKYAALARGEPVELHDLMAAMGRSEVAFNLLLEVRNRLVDAWEKISRSVV